MNITKLTEKYISDNPSIKDCVIKGIINYSALTREICDYHIIDKFDAVLIACRRYYWKIKKQDKHEKKIMDLVKNVKLRIRNKIIVAIIEKPRDMEKIYLFQKKVKKKKGDFNLIEGEDTITIITNKNYLDEIKELFKLKLIKINENLVQITMIFDEKIETTAGVVAYVYTLLAEKGINIYEEISCWTDLMVIIDEKDLVKAMDVLS